MCSSNRVQLVLGRLIVPRLNVLEESDHKDVMIVVVVLISSWYRESRNGWNAPLDTTSVMP